MRDPVRVFIVDPNPLARKALTEILSSRHELRVLGAAATPSIASRRAAGLDPEVFILDLEKPLADSLPALQSMRALFPAPAVFYTSLTEAERSRAESYAALANSEMFTKPATGLVQGISSDVEVLCDAIMRLASVARGQPGALRRPADFSASAGPSGEGGRLLKNAEFKSQIIAIGASTGGTQALQTLLRRLPRNAPGIVVVQHMPADFTGPFAKRLNESCHFSVREAIGGEQVQSGTVLIAHGGRHLEIVGSVGNLRTASRDGPKVSGHRPSVDVFFQSVAKVAGASAFGVLLTGMGQDGAAGLLEMRLAGCRTLAQDEQSSAVFGMPRAAYENGGAEELVPLDKMADRITELLP